MITGLFNCSATAVSWTAFPVGRMARLLRGGAVLASCWFSTAIAASAQPALPPHRPAIAPAQAQPSPDIPLPPKRDEAVPPRPAFVGPNGGGLGPALPAMPSLSRVEPSQPHSGGSDGPPALPKIPDRDEVAAAERVCAQLFGSGKVLARATAPIGGEEGCTVPAPIELLAVKLSPTRSVSLSPPVTINCALGIAVADWIRDDLAPLFTAQGKSLSGLSDTGGYACRGRNRVAGAKLSEHGKGNALDIGAFAAAGGPSIGVKESGAPLLAGVKQTACARFSTVLGPGSDCYHENHLHVDLAARLNGYRICH